MARRNPTLNIGLFNEFTRRTNDGCLLWLGRIDRAGYATYKGNNEVHYVHRWSYETFVAPIPAGLTIEHLCHDPEVCTLAVDCLHRCCVEPSHLVPMSNAENSMRGGSPLANKARQTNCIRGHELEGENLYVTPDGRRQCKTCRRDWKRRHVYQVLAMPPRANQTETRKISEKA